MAGSVWVVDSGIPPQAACRKYIRIAKRKALACFCDAERPLGVIGGNPLYGGA